MRPEARADRSAHASSTSTRTCARRSARGVDLLIVRELVGGLYYGARGMRENGTVFDTCEYHPDQVVRIARRAFELARGRGERLLSVDKANVLDTSRMWRRVVSEVAADYPDVELRHGLVDSVAMQLVMEPELLRHARDGEHLRRHPLRRCRGCHRRARPGRLGEPRRQGPGHLRARARLGARHRRHRAREPDGDAALARAARSSTGSARATLAPARSRPQSRSRSTQAPTPILAARATTRTSATRSSP